MISIHLEILLYGSPDKHRRFRELINKMEYEVEGDNRKGTTRPFLSEVKLYDIRILEEVAPLFLRDIKANTMDIIKKKHSISKLTGKKVKNNSVFHNFNLLAYWVKLFCFFFRLKSVKKADGRPDPRYRLTGWQHAFFIGAKEDPKQTCMGNGKLKEVL